MLGVTALFDRVYPFIGPLYISGAYIPDELVDEIEPLVAESYWGLTYSELLEMVQQLNELYLKTNRLTLIVESISTYELERFGCYQAVRKRFKPITTKTKALAFTYCNESFDVLKEPSTLWVNRVVAGRMGFCKEMNTAHKLTTLFATYSRCRKFIEYSKQYPSLILSINAAPSMLSYIKRLESFKSLPPFIISNTVLNSFSKNNIKASWFKEFKKEIKNESRRADSRLPEPESKVRDPSALDWQLSLHHDEY